MPFTVGLQIGPYRIMEQLGQGGMATVYKAYHASLDRYVAVKVLHQAFLEDPNFHARFQREARLVARLEHPNIVPIYDYAEYEGQPYLVMKYIEGETLKARLQSGLMNATDILTIVEAVGAGLAHAHKQGILHRDIKPSNVILSKDGGIYLADFGLARIAQSGESTLTSDMVLGTPQYISPEQAMAKKDLDEGTDIYSFGVMLYEMTVGRVPFSADTPFSVIHDHIYSPLPLPSTVNPNISPDLERVLLKALAKDRADRYKDVPAFVEAFKSAWTTSASTVAIPAPLDPAASTVPPAESTPSAPLTMPPAPGSPAPSEPAPAAVSDTGSQQRKKKSRNRWMWAAAGVGVCLCCVVGFFAIRAFNPDNPAEIIPPEIAETVAAEIATELPPPTAPEQPQQPQPEPPQGEDIQLDGVLLPAAEEAVKKNPNSPRAHLALGVALIDDGQERKGYEEIRKASDLGAKTPVFLVGAAKALTNIDLDLGAAMMYLHIAENARKNPKGPGLGQLIDDMHASVYYGFEQPFAPEMLDYGAITRLDEPMGLIAQARYIIVNRPEALADAQKMIDDLRRMHPGMAEADLLQAELFMEQENYDEAEKILVKMLDLREPPLWIAERVIELMDELP